MRFSLHLLLSLVTAVTYLSPVSARFALNGPVLTLTLKEPHSSSSSSSTTAEAAPISTSTTATTSTTTNAWIDLPSLHPNLLFEVISLQAPLPRWLPSLKQLKGRLGYQYNTLKTLPSYLEATAKFTTTHGELIVQPSFEPKNKRTTILLEASRGANWILAKLGGGGAGGLQSLRASTLFNLPYVTVNSLRVTPTLDVAQRNLALQLEAITGGFGRTRAVLNLELERPTLSVIYALDNRNTIAPTINLYNARIVYQWNCLLGRTGLSSLRTMVDPTSAIEVTWTDQSEEGGNWVTDFRLPLESGMKGAFAADVRVRRQFRF